jgi:hypothetical protein
MSAGRPFQGIGNGLKAFKVLLNPTADLFFLCKEEVVHLEIFQMEIVNGRWSGYYDDQMTIEENGRFGRAEEGLVWLGISNSIGLARRSLVAIYENNRKDI